jgi:hypothetical protein
MDFSFVYADMAGDLSNPTIAIAVAVAALVFGAWMVFVLRSRRPLWRTGVMLAVVFALGILGSKIAVFTARGILVARHSEPGVSIGFIGSVPSHIAPTAALILALIIHGLFTLWGLIRPAPRR